MSGAILFVVGGGALVIVGLAIAGGGRKETVRVGNTGVSLFGSVTQTFRSVGMAINGERQRTARDIEQKIFVNTPSPTEFGLPAASEPDLTRFSLEDAFENGEPDLFSLLSWDYGLVETLYGRDAELHAILDWAERGSNTATARLVTGEGGAGKTRLAAAAALKLREKGWTAGFITGSEAVLFDVAERGLFLIFDYPEEKVELTRALFAKLAELKSAPYPIRLLLLSRRPFEAWEHEAAILRLSELGRREEALERAEEAVAIRRELSRARPEAFTPDLAVSLNNLANRLSQLGRREEALERAEEAVRMVSVYSKACEAAQQEPDWDLLRPIVEHLQATSRG